MIRSICVFYVLSATALGDEVSKVHDPKSSFEFEAIAGSPHGSHATKSWSSFDPEGIIELQPSIVIRPTAIPPEKDVTIVEVHSAAMITWPNFDLSTKLYFRAGPAKRPVILELPKEFEKHLANISKSVSSNTTVFVRFGAQ